jgi:hypothetical protein
MTKEIKPISIDRIALNNILNPPYFQSSKKINYKFFLSSG